PLKLSEALGIMQRMRDNQHLDPDLYRLFLDAGVWRDYARTALDPEQLDVDDPSPYY
ncbi:MAG TPA: metal-dependent phosphohydrolase, partial [Alcanivorax sp.]|nr:metal-dependent phosphohydrolase [Alcanivorax sp.]